MTSPFANLFLALQQRISSNVPAIVHIDQDLGQLSIGKTNTRPPVSFPCVLIDFEHFNFESMGENAQTAKGTVVIRLAVAPHSKSAQTTPTEWLQQAIGYYDLEWTLHKQLQGWSPGDDFGALDRTGTTTQSNTPNYRIREIRYSLTFDDYSTKPQTTLAPAVMVVTEKIIR